MVILEYSLVVYIKETIVLESYLLNQFYRKAVKLTPLMVNEIIFKGCTF